MEEKIRTKLEEFRKYLQADGGDMEVVTIDGKAVTLRLKGACGSCPMSTMTLKMGVEKFLKQQVPEVKEVVQVA